MKSATLSRPRTKKKLSPHYHQSNGKSESAVKIVKTFLRKTEKTALNSFEALLDQHNTPTAGMTTSPAQRFLNRQTRKETPIKGTLLTPEIAKCYIRKPGKPRNLKFIITNLPEI